MSPEQARAKEVDARSDLFSFGAVLYEMATGQLAFRGGSSAEIFKAILDGPPAPVLRFNHDMPADFERIIHKALEKDRNLRYQSAADLRTALVRLNRDLDSGRSSATVSPSAMSPASSPSVLAATPTSRSRKYLLEPSSRRCWWPAQSAESISCAGNRTPNRSTRSPCFPS